MDMYDLASVIFLKKIQKDRTHLADLAAYIHTQLSAYTPLPRRRARPPHPPAPLYLSPLTSYRVAPSPLPPTTIITFLDKSHCRAE